MLCIDEVDEKFQPIKKKLYGNSATTPHRHYEIVYMPCSPVKRNASIYQNEETECLMDDPTDPVALE
jgi:hypothetical protein